MRVDPAGIRRHHEEVIGEPGHPDHLNRAVVGEERGQLPVPRQIPHAHVAATPTTNERLLIRIVATAQTPLSSHSGSS
ncbi:hypothetical protein [Streptomyces griseochromogenes]|uniref:hypothetical protein n=1 Tax=Streptomyces griseochromogenes TaxID=68214 RepID=UPI001331B5C1|nr:hypothetical protein [Streptomyces griseochromogenes]